MTDKKTIKKPTKVSAGIEVILEPTETIPQKRIYSNYVQITHTPYDFSLRFCDAIPLHRDNDTGGKVMHPIPIVAEIALPFNLIPGLIKALQTRYKLYEHSLEMAEDVKKISKK